MKMYVAGKPPQTINVVNPYDNSGAKATLAASGGDRLARGRRHRTIICQTQTLAAQEPDTTTAATATVSPGAGLPIRGKPPYAVTLACRARRDPL